MNWPMLLLGAWLTVLSLSAVRSALPAAWWFQPGAIHVEDAVVGECPVIAFDREINRPFHAEWVVTIMRRQPSGGFATYRTYFGENDYRPGNDLPELPDLCWWSWVSAMDLPPRRIPGAHALGDQPGAGRPAGNPPDQQLFHNLSQIGGRMMDFTGTGRRLTDIDLPEIGSAIQVGEDEIHAVLDVECRSRGFDVHARPAMLFETHQFYKFCPRAHRAEAVRLGLATRKWTRNYQPDSYPRLIKAAAYDLEAACKSASWGLGQIMGFNHQLAGYASAVEMVEAFKDGEAEQLRAMVRFIRNAGLDDALRSHDWRAFARGYNGPGYAKHGYHTRLEAAFRKWQAIPDTDWKRVKALDTAKTTSVPLPTEEIPDQGLWASIVAIVLGIFGGKS